MPNQSLVSPLLIGSLALNFCLLAVVVVGAIVILRSTPGTDGPAIAEEKPVLTPAMERVLNGDIDWDRWERDEIEVGAYVVSADESMLQVSVGTDDGIRSGADCRLYVVQADGESEALNATLEFTEVNKCTWLLRGERQVQAGEIVRVSNRR